MAYLMHNYLACLLFLNLQQRTTTEKKLLNHNPSKLRLQLTVTFGDSRFCLLYSSQHLSINSSIVPSPSYGIQCLSIKSIIPITSFSSASLSTYFMSSSVSDTWLTQSGVGLGCLGGIGTGSTLLIVLDFGSLLLVVVLVAVVVLSMSAIIQRVPLLAGLQNACGLTCTKKWCVLADAAACSRW